MQRYMQILPKSGSFAIKWQFYQILAKFFWSSFSFSATRACHSREPLRADAGMYSANRLKKAEPKISCLS